MSDVRGAAGRSSSDGEEFSPLVHNKRSEPPCRCCGFGPWLWGLSEGFGWKLLATLFVSQHLVKGFAYQFTSPAALFLLRSYSVPGPRIQVFKGVASLPFAMKPIIGLISDCFPICGYNKAPYIVLSSVAGVTAYALIGLMPPDVLAVELVVVCLFMIQLQISTCDLLTEAKYAEKMQVVPEKGPDLMTFVWFGLQLGGLVATVLVGPLLGWLGAKAVFLATILPASLIFVPILRNFLEESRQDVEQAAEARRRFAEQWEACMLCVLMLACTLLLSLLGIIFDNVALNATAAIVVALLMLVAFSLVLRPVIAKVNAFYLVQTALLLDVTGASFYFLTDSEKEYPDGPHFSVEFYSTVIGVVTAVFSLIGVASYQRFMKDWTYRRLILGTNLLVALTSFLDVVFFSRLNRRLGIPDHAFVIGSSALQYTVQMWRWMPGVVILSQLCPKGMEATMYALLAGCDNMGITIAANCGALMLSWLGCEPRGRAGEGMEFDSLWVASAISTALPVGTVLLIPWLIPAAKQTDKLLDEDVLDATSGSIWKQLTGQEA